MLVNPVVMLLAATAAFAGCRAAGINPHLEPMLLACGICLVASEAAIVPALLNRKPLAALVQATFLGTVIHLGFTGILGLVTLFALDPGTSFVYWLLGMYWLTLLTTSAVFIKLVRTKPDATAAVST
jgi:hypothetical protein